jgi:hypothetical protein
MNSSENMEPIYMFFMDRKPLFNMRSPQKEADIPFFVDVLLFAAVCLHKMPLRVDQRSMSRLLADDADRDTLFCQARIEEAQTPQMRRRSTPSVRLRCLRLEDESYA